MGKYICVAEANGVLDKRVISYLKGDPSTLRRGDFKPVVNSLMVRKVFRSFKAAQAACDLINRKYSDNFKPIEI